MVSWGWNWGEVFDDHCFQGGSVVSYEASSKTVPLRRSHLANEPLFDTDKLNFDLLVHAVNRDVLYLDRARLDLRDGGFGYGNRRVQCDLHVGGLE